ncbi:acetolactate synthase large subunit [Peribacillus psychrosaccharolyticus]|uniref:Acetolactate synthase n=1 Tax=Peribacillus psychrosaccharolyticus TaxID=1407 RepID=A0A974NKV5_PERPY|nr:acetolactate synthase large subunit [Peribacillus psychrosaccharolyticus]MEC2054620.1 acetolactate synthase large subunit [Peribacillus psychrosaccharolyticus]MED3744153.1 acetolactate synthase large subunit [Peribacillus psychrosaccharolyticus]QQS99644.1 acetolactate synthase large subunit [Peribacillus psychrosaccharolyticus]
MTEKALLTNREKVKVEKSGADFLMDALKKQNVDVIFGYPGGAVLPIYDKLYSSGLFHILTRHEQGSIHAAEGYARVTGKPGVVIATSGPGATNVVTGITDAMIDSLPLVIFTGQVATSVIGTDAFQEADVLGITTPITKHNYQVRKTEDIPRIVKEAFHIASSGRPGPVLIDIPKDIAILSGFADEDPEMDLPGYQPTVQPNHLQIRKLVEAVSSSEKPVILAGAGVLHSKGADELKTYAQQQGIPVVHTLLGLGGYPADHSLFIGMGGMHGSYAANMALSTCDLLINIGARFDDRLTGNLKYFAPYATVAHIDIDPAEIGKNIPTKIPVVGNAKEALTDLIAQDGKKPEVTKWIETINAWKKDFPLCYRNDTGALKPQKVIELLHQYTNGEAIVVTDVGQHQMWAAQYYPFNKPHAWVTSGGLGTMGFGLPAAIGAQIAEPENIVISISGDGGFQMTNQELAVIAEMNLPIKIVIINNHALGMVRQWQEIFHEKRYSHSTFQTQPDFVKLADAYGIPGFKATTEAEAIVLIEKAVTMNGPVLLDLHVEPEENVYPMVSPGKGLHEMEGVKQ